MAVAAPSRNDADVEYDHKDSATPAPAKEGGGSDDSFDDASIEDIKDEEEII